MPGVEMDVARHPLIIAVAVVIIQPITQVRRAVITHDRLHIQVGNPRQPQRQAAARAETHEADRLTLADCADFVGQFVEMPAGCSWPASSSEPRDHRGAVSWSAASCVCIGVGLGLGVAVAVEDEDQGRQ